jgi:hypothetical protein
MVVQAGADRRGLDCSVTGKYGAVLRTTVAGLLFVAQMLVNPGEETFPRPERSPQPVCQGVAMIR